MSALGRRARLGQCRPTLHTVAVELRDLESFLAVARDLHFARAADTLTITQPALSRRIQSLERELCVPLFVRNRRTVELTVAGQALVGPARETVEAARRVADAARAAAARRAGLVRVGYAGPSSHVMMAELARVVGEHRPGLTVELQSSNFALPALDKVVRGELDLAFGRWIDVPAGIASRIVAIESLVLVVADGHRLAHRGRASMDELRDERWVTLPSTLGSVLITELRRLATGAGFVPVVVQEAPDTSTLLALVGAKIGCSLTLSSVADNQTGGGVAYIGIDEATEPVLVRMAWRADTTNAALRALLSLTDELLPDPRVGPAVCSFAEPTGRELF
jgi:DNA-binding transcriptional LysR family regulator